MASETHFSIFPTSHRADTTTLLHALHHHHNSCSTGTTKCRAQLSDYSISAPSNGYPGEALPYHLPTLLPFSLLLCDGLCLPQPIVKQAFHEQRTFTESISNLTYKELI